MLIPPGSVNLRACRGVSYRRLTLCALRPWLSGTSGLLLESVGYIIIAQRFRRPPTKDANRTRPVNPSQMRNSFMPQPIGLLDSSRLLLEAASSGVGFFAAGDLWMYCFSSINAYAVLMPSSSARSRSRSWASSARSLIYTLSLSLAKIWRPMSFWPSTCVAMASRTLSLKSPSAKVP